MKLAVLVTFVSARLSLNSKFYMRKYSQLMSIFKHHYTNFDERKYWYYGCNCQILGQNNMAANGLGAPLDELDRTCKEYRECLQCAAEQFGTSCANESREYNFKTALGVQTCTDPENSCERSLCECAVKFAKNHSQKQHHYNLQEKSSKYLC